MKRNRDQDITCMCAAYDHPHRLGGGKCTGSAWCEAFRSIDSFECTACNHNRDDSTCDIMTGLEHISNSTCACVIEELRSRYLYNTYGHLPLDVEEYWEKAAREYYCPDV